MACNFGHLVAFFLLLVIGLAAVGTAGPHYVADVTNADGVSCRNQMFLYQTRLKCDGQSASTDKYDRDSFECKAMYDKLTAAYSLSIAACGVGFIAFVLTIITACDARIPSAVAVFFVILTFACLAAAFPLSESVRSMKQCGADSTLDDAGYAITWGLICLIVGFGISFILALISIIYGCIRPVVQVRKETQVRNIHEPALPPMQHQPVPQPQQQHQPVVMLQPIVVSQPDHLA